MEPARPAQAHTEVFAKNLIEPAPPKKIDQKLGSANSTQSIFLNFGWSQFNPNGFSRNACWAGSTRYFFRLICGLSWLKSEYFSKIRFEPAQSDHLPATIIIEPAQSKLCSTIRIEPAQCEKRNERKKENREKHVFWEEKGIVWKNPY